MKNVIESIVKHPAVSCIYSNSCKIELLTDNTALQALCRLRRMRRNGKQSIQNAREDVAAWGHTDSFAGMPSDDRQKQQLLIAYGLRTAQLPADLAELVQTTVETLYKAS